MGVLDGQNVLIIGSQMYESCYVMTYLTSHAASDGISIMLTLLMRLLSMWMLF